MFNIKVNFDDLAFEEKQKLHLYAKDKNGDPYVPSWIIINFRSNYSITNRYSVSVGLDNITNIRYRPYSSGISAPGRNFIIAIKGSF